MGSLEFNRNLGDVIVEDLVVTRGGVWYVAPVLQLGGSSATSVDVWYVSPLYLYKQDVAHLELALGMPVEEAFAAPAPSAAHAAGK